MFLFIQYEYIRYNNYIKSIDLHILKFGISIVLILQYKIQLFTINRKILYRVIKIISLFFQNFYNLKSLLFYIKINLV